MEIQHRAPLLQAADTPGVGSVYETNTAVTLDLLPEADAVLLGLSADQPASRADVALREALSRARDDRVREEAGASRIAAELAEHGAALAALRTRLADTSKEATSPPW